MNGKIIKEIEAGRLNFTEIDPPEWFYGGVNWFSKPPAVLYFDQPFKQFGGLALKNSNEILIFFHADSKTAEITLAHETAHFCTPLRFPAHGVYFLIQFGVLLSEFLDLNEIEPILSNCIESNWNKCCPGFLKKMALKKAMKILIDGGTLPRREPGWVHLFSGWIEGRLHHKSSVLVALVVGSVAVFCGLAGPLAGLAAGGIVGALLLLI